MTHFYEPDGSIDGDRLFRVLADLRQFLADNVSINGQPLGNSVTYDPGYQEDGIGVVIVPPAFEFGSQGGGITGATTQVVILAPNDSNVVANLMACAVGVADAIDRGTGHTVLDANSGTWLAGARMIPAYVINVSLDLNDAS